MKRSCPQCNKITEYKGKKAYEKAIQENRLCMPCAVKRRFQDKELRESQSRKIKEKWKDPKYREFQENMWQDPEFRENQSKKSKEKWDDPEYREKQTKRRSGKDFREKCSKSVKKLWENPEYRESQSRKIKEKWKDEKYREKQLARDAKKQSKITKKLWEDEEFRENQIKKHNTKEFREKMSSTGKQRWQDPEYREKQAVALANHPKVSSIQIILYSILDDLGIKYNREWNEKEDDPECRKGPWNFDCVIPRKGKTTLLIECQGNYWHSLPKGIKNDKSKATYIKKYYPDYEIKYIWEHEFSNYNKVVELIKYWTGQYKYEIIEYKFSDLIIKKPKAEEYKLLLSKYHYLPNAGRGGAVYGVYLSEELIGIVVFSSPIRQNIDIGKKFLELSRFCVHPKYQKKNLGSWFISRTIKLLKEERPDIEAILSYSDTTFNHDGALYKSLNFIQDRTVRPDYWYINEDKWVMHKKTLYGHAVKMKMKEKEYAEKNGYKKVYGKEKLRFVLEI